MPGGGVGVGVGVGRGVGTGAGVGAGAGTGVGVTGVPPESVVELPQPHVLRLNTTITVATKTRILNLLF
jgi:hypothetical protein